MGAVGSGSGRLNEGRRDEGKEGVQMGAEEGREEWQLT